MERRRLQTSNYLRENRGDSGGAWSAREDSSGSSGEVGSWADSLLIPCYFPEGFGFSCIHAGAASRFVSAGKISLLFSLSRELTLVSQHENKPGAAACARRQNPTSYGAGQITEDVGLATEAKQSTGSSIREDRKSVV